MSHRRQNAATNEIRCPLVDVIESEDDLDRVLTHIVEGLKLFFQPDDVFELRGLHTGEKTWLDAAEGYTERSRPINASGWFSAALFSDPKMVTRFKDQIKHTGGRAKIGLYFTPQQLDARYFTRRSTPQNYFCQVSKLKDGRTHCALNTDVTGRRYLLIDVDPVRAEGFRNCAATKAEKAAAFEVLGRVRDFLTDANWSAPIVVDSGNGYHAYYRLPELQPGGEQGANDPVWLLLRALGRQFSTHAAKIDQTTADAAQIMKVPGTSAKKGDGSGDRPHRRSWVMEVPADWQAGVYAPDPGKPQPNSIVELLAKLPPEPPPVPLPKVDPEKIKRYRGSDVIKRAIGWTRKKNPSIDGQNGHTALFLAARDLVVGYLLDHDTSFSILLNHFNPRCQGPWSEDELWRKIREVAKHRSTKYPDGWILYAPRKRQPSNQTKQKQPPADPTQPVHVKIDPETSDELIVVDGAGTPLVKIPAPKNRPVYRITGDEYVVNDAAVAALANDPDIYNRSGSLVRVIVEEAGESMGVRRPKGPRILQLSLATLRDRLTRLMVFEKEIYTKNGAIIKDVPPPDSCVKAVADHGVWPGMRKLEAVVDYPVVRPDGEILLKNGYDKQTGLFLNSDIDPELYDDVAEARDVLLSAVCDFPFKSLCHRSGWLASVLSPLAKFTIASPAPLFLFDANTPGTGKGLLCNITSLIISGKTFPTTGYAHDNEEMRKQITTVAVQGDRLILLDNIDGRFGNANLCAAITTVENWDQRLLGSNRSSNAPLVATWYATGNNVQLVGDMARRVCHVRLESDHERPEDRTGFKHADLREWVNENRAKLLGAALSILSKYIKANYPGKKLPPWGEFGGWTKLIRGAIVWLGEADPNESLVELRERADTNADAFERFLHNWEALCPTSKGLTTRDIVELAHVGRLGQMKEIQAAIDDLGCISDSNNMPSVKSLGKIISSNTGRIFGGRVIKKINSGKKKDSSRWGVYTTDGTLVVGIPAHSADDRTRLDPPCSESTSEKPTEELRPPHNPFPLH